MFRRVPVVHSTPTRTTGTTLASIVLAALVLGCPVDAQSRVASATPSLRYAPQQVLSAIDTRVATLQDLQLPQLAVRGFELEVDFGGRLAKLVLAAHDIRTRDYQLVVADASGQRVVPTPANTTYRGVLADRPGSAVAVSLYNGQMTAYVVFDRNEPAWSVQPLSSVDPNADPRTHVVHFGGDSTAPAGQCGTPDGTVGTDGRSVSSAVTGQRITFCELANDDDYEFYLSNGSSVAQTEANSTGVINACEVIYQRDTSIRYLLTRTIVRTARVYTTNDYGALLVQYRDRWRSYHGGIRRDISHLFTGKSRTTGVIGVAYLNSICSSSDGYGLSFTNYTSNLTNRVGLTAHELGHSWGAGHCTGSSCHIMCATLGGCSGSVALFGTASQAAIGATRDSRTCLDLSPFLRIGGGIVGVKGNPRFIGDGFIGSSIYPPKITLANYRDNAPGVFIIGLTPIKLPFLGGTLIPQIDYAVTITGSGADIVMDASTLSSSSLNNLWVQAFYVDAAAPQGVSATSGYRIFIR